MNKTTNEKSVPHIPMRFEDAIKAALETPPDRKPKKKAKPRKKAEQLLRPRAIERCIAFHFFFEPLGEAGFVHWLSQIVGLAFFWEHRLAADCAGHGRKAFFHWARSKQELSSHIMPLWSAVQASFPVINTEAYKSPQIAGRGFNRT